MTLHRRGFFATLAAAFGGAGVVAATKAAPVEVFPLAGTGAASPAPGLFLYRLVNTRGDVVSSVISRPVADMSTLGIPDWGRSKNRDLQASKHLAILQALGKDNPVVKYVDPHPSGCGDIITQYYPFPGASQHPDLRDRAATVSREAI